jgi:cobalt-zinc-cadmium efflux system outer membrane protein
MPFQLIFICAFCLGLAFPAAAVEVDLQEVGTRVSAGNPDLAAARFMLDEAAGRFLGAGRLMNPEVQFSGDRMYQGPERGFGVALMQRFPVTARLRLEKSVTAAQLKAAEAEVRDRQRMLVAEAEAMAVEILGTKGEIAVAERQAVLADKLVDLTTARAAASESAVDAAQMRLEARRQRNAIQRMQSEVARMTEQLKPMIGLSGTQPLAVTGTLRRMAPPPREAAPGDSRPDIAAAKGRADAAAEAVNLAKARKWEDVSVGVMVDQARRMDMPDGLRDETMVGLRLSIPLPFWNRNQGEIAETKAMHGRSLAEVTALRRKAAAEAAAAREEMVQLLPFIIENEEQLLPLARQQIERLREAYANNRATIQDLLRARDQLLMLEMESVRALRDFHLARTRWRAAVADNLAPAKR